MGWTLSVSEEFVDITLEGKMSSENHRILYLSRGGPVYGAQRQLLYLLKGLNRDRFSPVVLCTEEGPFLKELEDLHIPCMFWDRAGWRKLKHVLARYRDAADLCRFVKDEGISIVHGSDFQFSEYVLRSARSAGIPSVLHIRAPIDRRMADKYRCALATVVVAVSRRVELRLAQTAGIPSDKIVLIHDAVDQDLFQPANGRPEGNVLRRQYDTGDSVLVGIIGRVEKAKEQLAFIQIAGEILRKTEKATFFVIGEIRDTRYHARILREIQQNGLAGRVHFTGYREDMPQILAELDVLVSLSGGSVRYEAMMCGIPVICAWSRRPEESYCIRHSETGFLVPDRHIDSVSRVLLEVIADADLRQRVGRSARAWAQVHLSHSALVESTQNLYERLLGEGPGKQTQDHFIDCGGRASPILAAVASIWRPSRLVLQRGCSTSADLRRHRTGIL
jgi:glycosyltransferase involved in cell wall biosynthesis